MKRHFHSLVLVSAVLWMAGCARHVSIPAWQNTVERYLDEEANGDVSALRDMTWRGSEKGFAIISDNSPNESTDATGVLLGHPEVNGRQWVVFLVGLVRQRNVEQVRLAALSQDRDEREWVLGQPSPESLETYLKYREGSWKALFPGRAEAPTSWQGFPADEDEFTMAVEGNQVVAMHAKSGARWTVVIPDTSGMQGLVE